MRSEIINALLLREGANQMKSGTRIMLGFASIRFTRPQPSSRLMHRKNKNKENNEERSQVFNVENPNVVKATTVHKLQNTLYVRGIQPWRRKGNDL